MIHQDGPSVPSLGRGEIAMFQGFTEGIIGCLYGGGGGAPVEEYLTIKEVAQRLKLSPKTIRNKMAAGVFKRGVHYYRAPSLGIRVQVERH